MRPIFLGCATCLLALLILVAGCAKPIENGVVLDKRYVPESTYLMTFGDTMVPTTDPEEWQLLIREDGTDRVRWVSVGKDFYNAAKKATSTRNGDDYL